MADGDSRMAMMSVEEWGNDCQWCTFHAPFCHCATHFSKCRPPTLIRLDQKLRLTQMKKVIEPNAVKSSTD